jgi:hypothetical protein
MSGSIPFDRAASFYDRTRALTPESSAAITRLLGDELRGRGPALEIGVGTGLIALPLHAAGAARRSTSAGDARDPRRASDAWPSRSPWPTRRACHSPTAPRRRAVARHVLHLIRTGSAVADSFG